MRNVQTDAAPKAVGPYSQAIIAGDFIFCSGQIGLDPKTGALVSDDVRAQTRQVLTNLAAVLAAVESDLSCVTQTTIYLQEIGDFGAVNEEYASFFTSEAKPARATVAVARLPKDALVEISCVAYKTRS